MVVFRLIVGFVSKVIGVSVLAASISSCSHFYEVKSYNIDNKVVLEGETGERGSSIYEDQFAKKAASVCPAKSTYKILEKSHKPEIFSCAHDVLNPKFFYWVLECESN